MLALVTGAAKGIGRAIALELAKNNFDVAINYNSSSEAAKALATEIEKNYPNIKTGIFQADVSDKEQVAKLFADVKKLFSDKISILVNNAGITRDNLLIRMKFDDWDKVINANLNSVFYCTREAIRDMSKNKFGRIINISSIVGLIGNPGQANYSASKAAIIGFTKSVAREYASRGITANVIAPGFIDTNMTQELNDDVKTGILNSIPAGRIGSPEDVARAVLFFAREENSYITGQVLAVDGGITMC